MSKILSHIVKKAKNPRTIRLVKEDDFEKTIDSYPKRVRKIYDEHDFKPNEGKFFMFHKEDGSFGDIIFCLPEKIDIWTLADLADDLPVGTYALKGKLTKEEATNVTIGWQLGCYQFNNYRSGSPKKFSTLEAPKNADLKEVEIIVEGTNLTRDLVNIPCEELGPPEFAKIIKKVAKESKATLKELIGDSLLKAGYVSIHTVGRAAEKKPRLLDFQWGNKKHPKITLVGKGVCFDTGGLNIKGSSMKLMKKDMGGAAQVLALAQMIMKAKLKVNLRVMLPLVENNITDNAYRPSDIIRTKPGITVEVLNTDAEGRLILCEPLNEADKEKPELLIDCATLTGAARVAVGTEMAAFFTPDDKLASELEKAAQTENDPAWRLPLFEPYARYLDSDIADIQNIGGKYAGATTAALFLKRFIKNTNSWLHVDFMAYNMANLPGRPQGGDAMGLRAIYKLLKTRYS